MTKKNGQTTGAFSISKEFKDDVPRILESQKNSSRFICEAILEKYQREANPTAFRTADTASLLEIVISLNNINSSLERLNENTIHQLIDSKIRDFFGGLLSSNQRSDVPTLHIAESESKQSESHPLTSSEKPPVTAVNAVEQTNLNSENTDSDKDEMRNRFGKW